MKLKNIIREATAALKRNWVRSILTILGISVGVGAFICVVAIGNAGSSSIEKQLQNLGDNFIWIEAGSRARNGVRYGARGDRTLILGDATAIVEQVPLVKSMSPNADGHSQVVFGGENWVTMFRGSLPCSSRFDDGTRGWGHSSPKLTWMPQHRSAFSVKRWWTISSATRIPSARQYASTVCRAR